MGQQACYATRCVAWVYPYLALGGLRFRWQRDMTRLPTINLHRRRCVGLELTTPLQAPPTKAPAYTHHGRGFFFRLGDAARLAPTSALPRRADAAYTGNLRRFGRDDVVGEPHQYRKYRPDEPPARADDHLENHLLTEENARLKDELRRAEAALRVAAKVLGPYLK
jgi:hypothetical protein